MARVRWSAVTAVVLALTLVGGSGAARDPDQAPKGDSHRHVPGELIVKFRPGVTPSKKDEALAAAGLKAKKKLTADGRFELAAGDSDASEVALKKLCSDLRVAYAEPNFVVSALRTPNDPSFGQLWGLVNAGQPPAASTGRARRSGSTSSRSRSSGSWRERGARAEGRAVPIDSEERG